MSPRSRRYLQFAAASVLAFVLITFGLHLLVRMQYRQEDFAQLLSETFAHFPSLWQAIELTPFLILGVICASLANQSFARGMGLFVVGLAAFATLYYFGYVDTEAYMARRGWTAASITAGLIPFKCLGVVLLLVVARIFLGRANALGKA